MPEPATIAPDVRDAPAGPGGAGDGDPERRARLRRELLIFGIVGGFGLVALPLLVYFAGAATLGPYEGGLGPFLGKLYGDVITLRPSALGLIFGPYVTFQGVRLLTRPLRGAHGAGSARS
jgi:hypothetical protein